MGQASLVVRHADLTAMAEAMKTAHDRLKSTVADARTSADRTMSGWTQESASRAAQKSYDARFAAAHTDLLAGLDRVRTTLLQVQEDARQAEIRCVAILD